MSYLIFIWSPAGHNFLEPLAQHIGRKWNLTHSGDEQLASLDIILMSEPTLPDLTKPPPEMLMLWTEFF